jgi:ammonium transporter Rh
MLKPWLVILVGSIGGIISSVGFNKISSILPFHDTCGVHNLHGIPGVLGGLAAVIMAWVMNDKGVESIFGARKKGARGAYE